MEIETAVRKHLLNFPSVTNLVQKRVYKFELQEELEGTGRGALVVRRSGQWASPGRNSQEYPLLVVDCYSDNSRPDEQGLELLHDRDERAMQLYREVDRILHQVSGVQRHWPEQDPNGLYVIGCFRGSEPTSPAEYHGVSRVRVSYDVQVFH